MRVGDWYDCFQVDFNNAEDHLRARAPWDGQDPWQVGHVVFAYTTDDSLSFGCLARVVEVLPPESLHRKPGDPVPDHCLLILSRKADDAETDGGSAAAAGEPA